ncbi:trehalose-phosphatase [Pelagibius sp.]|uniref:trehalose-phosphatase n=1 Tax=Pelagibius sp. TaxID=1931238 RepID=UPI002609D9D7|nr:trehalose-phosphatase [Pelagibius sp.]
MDSASVTLKSNTGEALNPSESLPAESCALFLDVDGTLLPIAPRPQDVRVPPFLLSLLADIQNRLEGALALVSGRCVGELDALFSPLRLSAAGVHGLERRKSAGDTATGGQEDVLKPLRQPLADFAESHPGLLLEDKGLAMALHFRQAPELEDEAERMVATLLRNSGAALELQHGKMVLEVKPKGANKGTAVAAFMKEPPFRGRVPVFVGDDVTDEDGFEAVNRLGGLSVKVGAAGEATKATYRLQDEAAVHAWLTKFSADRTRV